MLKHIEKQQETDEVMDLGTLDREWIQLILEAKTLGLAVHEVRNFFSDSRQIIKES